jgi:YfiH family protein
LSPFFSTLSPDWNIPNVSAHTILATDSVSFSHDNLPARICRERLERLVGPEIPINWLRQVHGNRIVQLPFSDNEVEADGVFTFQKRTVCAVITADCLPIVFSDAKGTQVGVVHAGRRGLQNGIVSEMVGNFRAPAEELFAWIGPGIVAESYPISGAIREEVLALSASYEKLFTPGEQGQFYMDLYEMARMQLVGLGISRDRIGGASWDTFADNRFHSARRDKEQSGRMATVVWME